jgi:hypothetical protein
MRLHAVHHEPAAMTHHRRECLDAVERAIAAGLTPNQVIAALDRAVEAAADDGLTPRERQAAAGEARKGEMLAELERLRAGARARSAVMMVAKKFARDSLDPIEVASNARNLRRWAPKKKKRTKKRTLSI